MDKKWKKANNKSPIQAEKNHAVCLWANASEWAAMKAN